MHLSEILQLNAQVLPETALNQSVIWSSSNPNVAVVDQTGKVTTKGTGAATITVKTVEGGFTASCYITVVNPVTGVKLNKNAMTLIIAAEETLVASVLPEDASNKNVTWSSANGAIATVDANGKVKGIAVGQTVITVTTVGGGFTATCTVTVIASYPTPTGIAVTPKTLNMDKGATYPLAATVTPAGANPAITWSSSSTAIATVDAAGIITATGAGKATITAKTINGLSATCTVTVTVPVESIEVDPSECTLAFKGTKSLKATVYPTDATNKTITWSSSNTAIATVSTSGAVTAKSINGEVKIYATNAASGIVGVCTITVGTGNGGAPMGIDEQDLAKITVYPNPTDGELYVTCDALHVTGIEVFDVMGRKIQNSEFQIQNSEIRNPKSETINISDLPTGVYFIRITTDNGIVTRKIVKN
jgi:uncharacterized protein YjdB